MDTVNKTKETKQQPAISKPNAVAKQPASVSKPVPIATKPGAGNKTAPTSKQPAKTSKPTASTKASSQVINSKVSNTTTKSVESTISNTKAKPINSKVSNTTAKLVKSKPASKTSPKSGNSKAASKSIIAKAAKEAVAPSFKLVAANVAQQEMNLLCQQYPEAECELDYGSAFQLLTAVIMSAQTTDVTVNKVTPTLFERFPDAKSLAEADLDEVKEIIKPTGFFNAKANNIQKCAQALVANFGGVVPQTIEELTTLPGVGRKTANVVLGVIFGVPGWTVDTHVQRLSARMGFTKNTEPEKIEVDLQKLFPNQDWSQLSITLIWHGRRMCFARKPDCARCPVNNLCPSSMV
jgi:endonuclease-3